MIFEKTLGYDHAVVARSVANLAKLLEKKGDYDQADGLAGAFFQRTLATSESAQGAHHADVARALADLARLREKKGRYAEAEGMVRRALGISESALGAGHALTRHLRTELESLKLQASDYNASAVALSGSVGDDQISAQAALAHP